MREKYTTFFEQFEFFPDGGEKKMQSARKLLCIFGDFVSAESDVIAHPVGQFFQPFQGDGGLGQGLHGNAH